MKENLFRGETLKRLSSPEQLDQLIKVTSPKAWLALISICLMLAAAVVWSFLGSIPTKITGKGIFMNNGGVIELTHFASGQVIDLRFSAGAKVKKGDVIARIEQKELTDQINALLDQLTELEKNGNKDSLEYIHILKQVDTLRADLDNCSQIISPIDGRILEMNMRRGSIAAAGDTLASLEMDGAAVRMQAVLYLPAELAGKIRTGMEVQLSPAIVNKEEYGYMLGRVTSVAEYPETPQSMMQTLGNENLITLLSGYDAELKIEVDLTPNSGTVSGYKWSSPEGPPLTIPSGTLTDGAVVISREKPISKMIPFFNTPAAINRAQESGNQ